MDIIGTQASNTSNACTHTRMHRHSPFPSSPSLLTTTKTVLVAPVLPTACVAFALLCLLALLRFHPKGIFHPNNEPDRDFPSMYHPKSAIRHRMRQREKERQQRRALLSSERGEGMGCELEDVRTVEEGKIGEEVGVGVVRG